MHHALLYISLLSLHDYDVKMLNFTFFGEHELKTKTFFFFSWTSNSTPEKIRNIWRTERDGISANNLKQHKFTFKWYFQSRSHHCRCFLSSLISTQGNHYSGDTLATDANVPWIEVHLQWRLLWGLLVINTQIYMWIFLFCLRGS